MKDSCFDARIQKQPMYNISLNNLSLAETRILANVCWALSIILWISWFNEPIDRHLNKKLLKMNFSVISERLQTFTSYYNLIIIILFKSYYFDFKFVAHLKWWVGSLSYKYFSFDFESICFIRSEISRKFWNLFLHLLWTISQGHIHKRA